MHALVLAALLFSPSPVLAQESRDTFVAEATASAAADVVPTGDDGAARMTVPVMVNGEGPFSFVIDTGADRTVISRELAERLALRKAGNVRLHAMGGSGRVDVVKVDHLQISPRVSRRLEAAALPRQYIGADGLLGLDSLKGQRIIMDFRAGTMTLEPATQRERDVDSASDVIVVTARSRLGQLVMVDADANGQKVWVVVDTGAQNSVGNLRLKRLMLARDPRTTTRPIEMIDVLGQRTPADYTIVNRLRIGGGLLGLAGAVDLVEHLAEALLGGVAPGARAPRVLALDVFEPIDVGGRCVIPGFVDSHTHLVFAGDRAAEFEARMAGRP